MTQQYHEMYNQQNSMDDFSDNHELSDDAAELIFLIDTQLSRIDNFLKLTPRAIATQPETLLLAQKQLSEPRQEYLRCKRELGTAITHALIHQTRATVRTLQGVVGAALVSVDWQAPSYDYTNFSQAGTQIGKIEGTINDYKRDRNLDAAQYEQQFYYSNIDTGLRIPTAIFATSSGMSAFTTILTALQLDKFIDGPVLAGQSCYFECRQILQNYFPDNLYFVNESSVDEVLATVHELQPAVIFLDTLCNTASITVPNMREIIKRLVAEIKRPTTLVLDNTGLGIFYQPFKDLPLFTSKLFIITFESLAKYHQFGMDRVTGGIIWTKGLPPLRLHEWRMHLGTNISDIAAVTLPSPNRALLCARMLRHGRNALFLAKKIDEHIKASEKTPFTHVEYPGLAHHSCYAWTQSREFNGSYFTIICKPELYCPEVYKKFISHAIDLGKKAGIDLIAGTSFGFNTTRLYLTALNATGITQPFLRISAGTETISEIQKIADVLIAAINKTPAL